MKFAEDLLTLIERKNLIAPDLLAELRSRLTGISEPVPADMFAIRLVEHQVLTGSLAESLLRELNQVPVPPPPLPLPPSEPVIDLADIEKPKNGDELTLEVDEELQLEIEDEPEKVPVIHPPQVDYPAAETAGTEQEPAAPAASAEQIYRKKRFAVKKKTDNLWDTKLILFGGTGLLILCLAGIFLTGSLFRRSADAMYAEADKLYQSGSYSPAITAYTEFIEKFPNHSETSAAKIRRALARIRILVDAKTDWTKTLQTAEEEIESVKNEQRFFEESKAELAVLLPKIAAGLAAEAEEKTSIQHSEQAEQAVKLIETVLPSSLRPAETLLEVQYKVAKVRRLLVQQDILNETQQKLDGVLAAEPFGRKETEQCYELLAAVLKDNPELELDTEFIALRQRISENEYRAVRPLSDAELPKENANISGETRSVAEIAVLYNRKALADFKPLFAGQVPPQTPLFVFSAGTVFALNSADGTLLWHYTGGAAGSTVAGSRIDFIPVPKTEKNGESVLVVGPQGITRLDGQTGKPVWHLPVDEPFYCTEVFSRTAAPPVFCIATRSGKILTVQFDTADHFACRITGWSVPQNVSVAPLFDIESGLLYQPGGHDTLFVIPLNGGKAQTYFTAHQPGSLRTEPVKFGTCLLLVRQAGARTCELQVYSTGEKLTLLQTFPVSGLTDTPPAVDGSFGVLISDNGETQLFDLSGDAKNPLRKIAAGSSGGKVEQQNENSGNVRYAALTEKNVWIADRQLMRYEPQLAQSRLLPQESLRKDIITLAPLRKIGNTLFHTFRRPNAGGTLIQAVATDTAKVCWETEVADPPVLATLSEDVQTLFVYTNGGKLYQIQLNLPASGAAQLFTALPADNSPLIDVVPLKDGFAAWITASLIHPADEGSIENKTLMMYDPAAADATRFRSLLLPSPLTALPAALDGNLLAPMQNGSVALLDPKTGQQVAQPFIPKFSETHSILWGKPEPIENTNEFLITDKTQEERTGKCTLYKAALEDGKLVLKQKTAVDGTLPPVKPVEPDGIIFTSKTGTVWKLGNNGIVYRMKGER
ncbi:MAG: PQQ-like beta-propeller repeat protein [Planctomycetaceae bacterium]|jgi:outer membrane protein assembly factor BamB|nr:PQQ-like beta-propeller repeat protein [Planctomycetaceae bacterium]